MKLCRDCKHVRGADSHDGAYAKCAREEIPTGFGDYGGLKYCSLIRGCNWLTARIVFHNCGREGRFWERRDE